MKRFFMVAMLSAMVALTGCGMGHSGDDANPEGAAYTAGITDVNDTNTTDVAESAATQDARTYAADDDRGWSEADDAVDPPPVKRKTVSDARAALTPAAAAHTYYFDFDNSVVHAADKASLKAQANYLLRHPAAAIKLAGHTDERGSREYNIALGWRRARSVVLSLEQQGVGKKQINTVSYGKEKPAVLGHKESVWRKNRRVELTRLHG